MTDSIYKGDDFESKVRKQVEFYFSDSNLLTDKFLFKIYEANDGWVELKTILTFSRMRQFRPEERVIAALKESEKLVLSPNEDLIRRKEPLKDFNEVKNNRKRNTVHIEGFPHEATQEELETFFNKLAENLPKEKSITSLRRIKKRANNEFFGVVDVEFNTQEDAEFALNDLSFAYPDGVLPEDASEEKKSMLKKMSLLTFQELRANSKRFGVNDVTRRRESFNESQRKKLKKNPKGQDETKEESKETKEEAKEETKEEAKEETKEEAKEVKE